MRCTHALLRAAMLSCAGTFPLTAGAPRGSAQAPPTVTVQASPTTQNLVGLFSVSDRVVWASGAGGTWLLTTDGGEHWRSGVVPGAEALRFRDVHATDSLTAWLLAIGFDDSSRIYHTSDGGRHWQTQFLNLDPGAFYDCFAFWDARRAIAIADAVDGRIPILLTSDGGAHWAPLPFESQPAADAGEASPAASGTCVVVQGSGHAWLGTTNSPLGTRVLRTADGGRTWQASVTPVGGGAPLSAVASLAFRDSLHGFAGGWDQPRVARTDDGGRTWAVAGEPAFGGSVYGLALVPGRRGVVVAVGPGGASISRDDGATWQALDEGNSWSVAFADGGTGWMVGARGRIAKIELR